MKQIKVMLLLLVMTLPAGSLTAQDAPRKNATVSPGPKSATPIGWNTELRMVHIEVAR